MSVRFPSIDVLPQRYREQANRQLAPRAVPAPARQESPRTPPATRKPRRDDEHNEQVVFFNRIRTLAMNDTRYAQAARRTFAIPNGGGRSKSQAGRLKAEGVMPGVSDIFCALPTPKAAGLWIEMKSLTGSASREQVAWLSEGEGLGYAGAVCRGHDVAFALWKAYVDDAIGGAR